MAKRQVQSVKRALARWTNTSIRTAMEMVLEADPARDGTPARAPVRLSAAEVAADMGVLATEAQGGMELLRDTGVVRSGGAGEGVQLDPDVLCEQPLLATIDWPGVRARLEGERRIGPALAVLRELGRLGSARGVDAPIATHLPELVDATLYGRSTRRTLGDESRRSCKAEGRTTRTGAPGEGAPVSRAKANRGRISPLLALNVRAASRGTVPRSGRGASHRSRGGQRAEHPGAGPLIPQPYPRPRQGDSWNSA